MKNSVFFLRAQRSQQGNYLNHTGGVQIREKGPGAQEGDLGVEMNLQVSTASDCSAVRLDWVKNPALPLN